MLSTSVVVLDFETTGLGPSCGITEVAALRLSGRRVVDRYVTLANPGAPIPFDTQRINGITDQLVANAPHAAVVIRQLVEFIGSDIVVAHHARFEAAVLSTQCRRAGLPDRSFEMLCTMLLARRLLPGLSNYKLITVSGHLGIVFPGSPHRAEPDAQVTAELLLRLSDSVVDTYAVHAVPTHLLQQVSRWPLKTAPDRLRRALRATEVASSPATITQTGATRPTRPQPLAPTEKTSQRARSLAGIAPPVPAEPWTNPAIPSATDWSPAAMSPTVDAITSAIHRRERRDDPPPAGQRWWLDDDGDLHDRDNGRLYQRRLGAVAIVLHPEPGVTINDPTDGEYFVPGRIIYGFPRGMV